MKTALKQWLEKNCEVATDADDAAFESALGKAVANKTLTTEKWTELETAEEETAANSLDKKLDLILQKTEANEKAISELRQGGETETTVELADGAPELKVGDNDTDIKGHLAAGADTGGTQVNVKSVETMYSTERKSMVYPTKTRNGHPHHLAGQPVFDAATQKTLETPCDLDLAICGMWVKRNVVQQIPPHMLPCKWTEHDQQLLDYAARELNWGGWVETPKSETFIVNERLDDMLIKAVGDETASGGLEIAPIVFDEQIIKTPFLYGEFFPKVTVVPLTRGRRVEGASMAQVTLSSQAQDHTQAIPLQTTANFITAFDTNVHVVNGGIEISMDLLSDTPIQLGKDVTGAYGEALLTWLDEQIQVGDGTSEPEGVFNASGTISVAGGDANLTAAKYLDMQFGVKKQFKNGAAKNQIAFGGTEVSYNRARQLALGAGGLTEGHIDQAHDSYSVFGQPYGIAGTWQTNAQISYGNYKRFRMYRRLGAQFRTETGGKTLARANNMLILMRARFGGQLEDANTFSICSTAAT